MPQVQTGHEHEDGGRGTVITLNDQMLAGLDEHQRAQVVDAFVAAAAHAGSEDDVAQVLSRRLGDAGVVQPDVVISRYAERLRVPGELTIVTDSGAVLHGDPSFDPARIDPDVHGTEDPEHGDRPVYS